MSNSKTDIWMPVYIGDYLKDTQHLTSQQHGIYFLLWMHYWQKGMLQASFKQCSNIAKAYTPEQHDDLKFVLSEFFTECDNKYIQKRIEAELSKARDRKEVYSERARKAADKRWKDASSNSQALLKDMLEECPSSSSSSSSSSLQAPLPAPSRKYKRVIVQKPEEVSEQTWQDFVTLRKDKKATITETALNGIKDEAVKAGYTLEDALKTCCQMGWRGFKAEWVKDIKKRDSFTGLATKNYREGVGDDGKF